MFLSSIRWDLFFESPEFSHYSHLKPYVLRDLLTQGHEHHQDLVELYSKAFVWALKQKRT